MRFGFLTANVTRYDKLARNFLGGVELIVAITPCAHGRVVTVLAYHNGVVDMPGVSSAETLSKSIYTFTTK
jgi:hypothetical protein